MKTISHPKPKRIEAKIPLGRGHLGLTVLSVFACLTPILGGEIHEAIRSGRPDLAAKLLAETPELRNARDSRGDTPLHIAVRRGDQPMVEVLLGTQPDLNVINEAGVTPLKLARGLGRHGIAGQLEGRGAKAYPCPPRDVRWTGDGRRLTATCSGCGAPVSAYAVVGDDCPRCGVRWTDEKQIEVVAVTPQRPVVPVLPALWAGLGGGGFEAPEHRAAAPAVLPPVRFPLGRGLNTIRIQNPNPYAALVGLRQGVRGGNLMVRPGGLSTVFVPDGHYDVYFIFTHQPERLYQGDSLSVFGTAWNARAITLRLVATPGGNYPIRPVN